MFNHNTLEDDIKLLGREVAEKKSEPESKDLSEKEIIKRTIAPFINQPPASGTNPQTQTILEEESFHPDYLKDSPAEIKLQVEKLIDNVFHIGLRKAAAEARKKTPFLLDSFHDSLADKLHEELKKRKLI